LIAFVIFFNALRVWSISLPAGLGNGLDNFAGWGSVFLKLIPLCSAAFLLCHLPVVLRFLLGDMYRSSVCCFGELPNIRLRDAFFASSWRGMGNNGGDIIIIYALGISLPLW
jgi:hypothetical protein